MKFTLTFFFLFLILIALSLPIIRYVRIRNNRLKKYSNIARWMRMSSAERNEIDKKEKEKTMMRKKLLLKEIRKEYKDLKEE